MKKQILTTFVVPVIVLVIATGCENKNTGGKGSGTNTMQNLITSNFTQNNVTAINSTQTPKTSNYTQTTMYNSTAPILQNTTSPGKSDYVKDPDNIDPALALKLREDFRKYLNGIYPGEKWKLDDIWVQEYFGNYNGCEIAYMGCSMEYTAALRYVEIATYTIVFPSGQEVYAYKDSKFYTLKEAYDAKLLTKTDIYNIGKQVDSDFIKQNPNP